MGTFSVLFADTTNKTFSTNLMEGMPFKVLIPEEFGGGFLEDNGYYGYGQITDSNTDKIYDWYDLIAAWDVNEDAINYYINKVDTLKTELTNELMKKFPAIEVVNSELKARESLIEKFFDYTIQILDEKIKLANNDYYLKWIKETKSNIMLDFEKYKSLKSQNASIFGINPLDLSLRIVYGRLSNQLIKFTLIDSEDAKYLALDSNYSNSLSFPNMNFVLDKFKTKYPYGVTKLPTKDKFDGLRNFGIDIACYDLQHSCLKYPLKIVPIDYVGTYEDCNGFSGSDLSQGWGLSDVVKDNYPVTYDFYHNYDDVFFDDILPVTKIEELENYLAEFQIDYPTILQDVPMEALFNELKNLKSYKTF